MTIPSTGRTRGRGTRRAVSTLVLRRVTAVLLACGLAFSLVGTCPCQVAAADGCDGMVGHAAARPSCCEKTSSRPELRPAPCCDSKDGDDTGVMTASITAPGPEAPSSLAVVPGGERPLAVGFADLSHRAVPPSLHASSILRI